LSPSRPVLPLAPRVLPDDRFGASSRIRRFVGHRLQSAANRPSRSRNRFRNLFARRRFGFPRSRHEARRATLIAPPSVLASTATKATSIDTDSSGIAITRAGGCSASARSAVTTMSAMTEISCCRKPTRALACDGSRSTQARQSSALIDRRKRPLPAPIRFHKIEPCIKSWDDAQRQPADPGKVVLPQGRMWPNRQSDGSSHARRSRKEDRREMPIKIPDDLPARRTLEAEGVMVMRETDAVRRT
jgi:hypothetical protein